MKDVFYVCVCLDGYNFLFVSFPITVIKDPLKANLMRQRVDFHSQFMTLVHHIWEVMVAEA